MNRIWIYFNREARSIRDVYFFIRLIHYEKNNDNFEKSFETNNSEISYRSLLSKSLVKKYINVLISLGLIERELIRTKGKEKFTTVSNYKVKKLDNNLIKQANEKKDDAIILSYDKSYRHI